MVISTLSKNYLYINLVDIRYICNYNINQSAHKFDCYKKNTNNTNDVKKCLRIPYSIEQYTINMHGIYNNASMLRTIFYLHTRVHSSHIESHLEGR